MAWRRRKSSKASENAGLVSTVSSSTTKKRTKKAADPSAPKKKRGAKKERLPHMITTEELLADGELILEMEIPKRPMTKKTHQDIIYVKGKPLIVPAKTFQKYEKEAREYCLSVWSDRGFRPMDFGISIELHIHLKNFAGVGDATGYFQSIGDVLQTHDVIADDKWISWETAEPYWLHIDGTEKAIIRIRRQRHPYEEFRVKAEAAEQRKLAKQMTKSPLEA